MAAGQAVAEDGPPAVVEAMSSADTVEAWPLPVVEAMRCRVCRHLVEVREQEATTETWRGRVTIAYRTGVCGHHLGSRVVRREASA